jgi:DNA-binding NtrC family response regulator
MRILIIDDDTELLASLSDTVAAWGGEAHCVENSAEAALALSHNHYDFILLDLRMPIRNGVWFLENAMVPSQTTVIAMSEQPPQGAALQRLRRLGVVDHIEKPFTSPELLEILQRSAHGHLHTCAA